MLKLTGAAEKYFNSENGKSLCSFLELWDKRNKSTSGIIEVRILKAPGLLGKVWHGYYNKFTKLMADIFPLPNFPRAKIPYGEHPRIGEAQHYVTMNPVHPDLLARSANEIKRCSTGEATSDDDVDCYNMCFIDIDPKRRGGISANRDERREARKVSLRIKKFLRKKGIKPISASSGNGYHLIILTKHYKGEGISKAAKQGTRILEYLKHKFETDGAEIDTGVCSPAHLIKLYGTMAIKGSNVPERPWRYATIDVPEKIPEDVDIFEMLKDELKEYENENEALNSANKFDKRPAEYSNHKDGDRVIQLENIIKKADLEYKRINKKNYVVFSFRECPHHKGNKEDKFECCVTVSSDNGKFGASCKHDKSATWDDFSRHLGVPELSGAPKESSMFDISDAPFKCLGFSHGVFYYSCIVVYCIFVTFKEDSIMALTYYNTCII